MIKRIFLTLLTISFASVQVMAMSCGAACSMHEVSVEKSSSGEHDCCPKKDEKKEKEKSSHCNGEFNGMCFHEVAGDKVSLSNHSEGITERIILLQELAVLFKINLPGINHRYRPKIPKDQFLNHKTQTKSSILQDKFLI